MKHVPSAGVVEYRFVASDVEAAVAGRVDGFACPFDVLDSHDTRFAPGCFVKSIAAWKSRGRTLPMYVNHADNRPVGGWLDLVEGPDGLRAVGEIVSTEREWVGGLFRMKVVLGMSIGFVPVAWRVETDGSVTFTEVSLREISLVTANSVPGAVIESLRGEAGLPRTKRDFEHLLKRIGFSGNAARAITSSGFKETDLREGADPTGLIEDLQDQLFLMRLSHVARHP